MAINRLSMLVFSLVLLSACLYGQTPQAMKYQAIARDASGNPISNQTVSLRISILQGSVSGTVVYTENHAALTNNLGLTNINIGLGTPVLGTFSGINWGAGTFYIKVEMDITGGVSYVDMGTSQLLSVPYAIYAENVHNAPGHPHTLSLVGNNLSMTNGNTVTLPTGLPTGSSGNTLRHDGTSWVSNSLLSNTGTAIGIGTAFPTSKLHVLDDIIDKAVILTNNYTGSASKYGLFSTLSVDGMGAKYGVYSTVTGNPSSNLTNYGVYSYMNSNSTTGNVYGLYTNVANTGTGSHFGVYSYTPGGWAGYFSSGNVYVADNMAIGTTTIPAGFVVAINGKMICEELKVQLNASWPDYVFKPGHKLASLPELESEIRSLGHLPGMPSAAEVKEQGLGVGEISLQLTQKVEELTLYLIGLNKQVEALQKENAELKMAINH